MNASKPATAVVEIELTARTRVVYTEHVIVPSGLNASDLAALADARYALSNGSEFVSDPEYWEGGSRSAYYVPESQAHPLTVATRDGDAWTFVQVDDNVRAASLNLTLEPGGSSNNPRERETPAATRPTLSKDERERFAQWLEYDFPSDAEEERMHRKYLAGLLRQSH